MGDEHAAGDEVIITSCMKMLPRTSEAYGITNLFNNLECSRKSRSFKFQLDKEREERKKELSYLGT
jgi:hypothetical protein